MRLLFILLFAPLFSFAQDCHVTREVDKFTDSVRIDGGAWVANTSGGIIAFSIVKEGLFSTLSVTISTGDNYCFDESSDITFLFSDNTKLKLKADNKINCEGYVSVSFLSNSVGLKQLSTKRVTDLRLNSKNSVTDVTINGEEGTDMQQHLSCFFKEINR